MDILDFSYLLCGGLRQQINQRSAKLPILQRQGNDQALPLEHRRDKNGIIQQLKMIKGEDMLLGNVCP